jgi:hypothetical protein
MRRLHLFEFHEQSWFPKKLRDALTAYLCAAYRISPLPKLWAEQIAEVLTSSGLNKIVDLCSGSGGPLAIVAEELKKSGLSPGIVLTDLYPNPSASGSFKYWPEAVDATEVPAALDGVRTMFAAFHHFRPEAARRILQDAFDHRRPMCIFEATSRTPVSVLSALIIPLVVLLVTPLIRPVTLFQLFFTYLVPIIPILIFWDGLVSNLRTYSPDELIEFTRTLDSPDYSWKSGLVQAGRMPVGLPYLTGCARSGNCAGTPTSVLG